MSMSPSQDLRSTLDQKWVYSPQTSAAFSDISWIHLLNSAAIKWCLLPERTTSSCCPADSYEASSLHSASSSFFLSSSCHHYHFPHSSSVCPCEFLCFGLSFYPPSLLLPWIFHRQKPSATCGSRPMPWEVQTHPGLNGSAPFHPSMPGSPLNHRTLNLEFHMFYTRTQLINDTIFFF